VLAQNYGIHFRFYLKKVPQIRATPDDDHGAPPHVNQPSGRPRHHTIVSIISWTISGVVPG
jgi:hypothetical protein